MYDTTMIKRIAIGALALASFVGVAVFGIMVMGHDGNHHNGCIGATAAGAVCPEAGPFSYAAFHLKAFLRFSTGIPLAALLAAMMIVVFTLTSLFLFAPALAEMNGSFVFAVNGGEDPNPLLVRLRSFFALHERVDALALS
jgi:hypothetical protein